MTQVIKYEDTKIEATASAMKLSELVQRYGGTRFEMAWEDGLLIGIRFAISHEGLGEIPVRLSARVEEVLATLRQRKPFHNRMRKTEEQWKEDTAAQAYRIAWRHLKDLCEQILLATELGAVKLHEGFLWAMEVEHPGTGEVTTMGQLLESSAQAIGAGGALRLMAGDEPPVLDADFEEVGG